MKKTNSVSPFKLGSPQAKSFGEFGLFLLFISIAFMPIHSQVPVFGIGFFLAIISSIVIPVMMFGDPAYMTNRVNEKQVRGAPEYTKIPLFGAATFGGLAVALFIPISAFDIKLAGIMSVTSAFIGLGCLALCLLTCLWDISRHKIEKFGCYHYRFKPIRPRLFSVMTSVSLAYGLLVAMALSRLWLFTIHGILDA